MESGHYAMYSLAFDISKLTPFNLRYSAF